MILSRPQKWLWKKMTFFLDTGLIGMYKDKSCLLSLPSIYCHHFSDDGNDHSPQKVYLPNHLILTTLFVSFL